MNLHGLVARAVGTVNPLTTAGVQVSTGYTTAPDGTREPTYAAPVIVLAQAQAVTTADLRQLAELDIQGVTQTVYLPLDVEGVLRPDNKGGDLVTLGGQVWLTTAVLERWPQWVKVALTLQGAS